MISASATQNLSPLSTEIANDQYSSETSTDSNSQIGDTQRHEKIQDIRQLNNIEEARIGQQHATVNMRTNIQLRINDATEQKQLLITGLHHANQELTHLKQHRHRLHVFSFLNISDCIGLHPKENSLKKFIKNTESRISTLSEEINTLNHQLN